MPQHPLYAAARAKYEAMAQEIQYKKGDLQFVGTNAARFDAYPKASGNAMYASDIQLPGMIWGKFLHSPYAHAKIMSIDTTDAAAIPGVRAILTYADAEPIDATLPIPITKMLISGSVADSGGVINSESDLTFVIPQSANFEGESVGVAVCADSEEICDEALTALKIEWKELPAVLNVEQAMAEGAPLCFDNKPGNVWLPMSSSRGKILGDNPYNEDETYTVEQGFKDADIIIEDRIKWDPIPMHGAEPNSAIAKWDDNKLTIWIHTQRPQSRPAQLSAVLGIPASNIVMNFPYNGGCFGQNHLWSSEQARYDVVTALLAKKAGRPVKMQMSRKDYFLGSDIEAIIDMKIGCKNDGTITAVYGDILWGGGAPGGAATLWGGYNHAFNWIDIDLKCAYKTDSTTYFVNKVPVWWWRSEQDVNARCLQQVIDYVAYATGVDPAEVFTKNARINNEGQKSVIEEAKAQIDWDTKWHKPGARTLSNGKLHGMGFYFGHEWGAYTDVNVSAALRCNPDGTVTVQGIKEDLGCSEHTTYAMIVAEEMGMKLSDVNFPVMNSDCGYVLQGSGGASGLSGSAWCLAKLGIKAKTEILKRAVTVFGVTSADELDMKDSVIFAKADTSKTLPIAKLFTITDGGSTWMFTSSEIGGYYWMEENIYKIFVPMHCYLAFLCEVEVDPETGGVDVIKVVTVNDVGKAIRPATVDGQLYGGTFMALGRGLLQDQTIYDPGTGVRLTSDLLHTHIAINKDCGPITTVIKEFGHGEGPYGLMGVGEDTTDSGSCAFMSAVYNAIGKKVDPPCTPVSILKALGKA
jgi:CO/xanthine dehydrogenase Mo-binding subunit